MSALTPCILVVDDEPAIRRLLRNTLKVNGCETLEAATAAEALAAAAQKPDVVLLDLGLPDGDGLELLAPLRAAGAQAIIVLTSRDDERSKVTALDAGADDYVTKPFGAEELMARVRAALRHRLQRQGSAPVYEALGLRVDLVQRQVTLRGEALHLSPKEYALLTELAQHAGKVLTHRHLLQKVWGSAVDADVQYLRVYMRQLRAKIERSPDDPQLLLTESGIGYRLRLG